MRIVIELKRGADPDRPQPALQAHPDAGELLDDLPGRHQRPARETALPEAIRIFIEHRQDVVRRRTAFLLRKAASASTSCLAIRSRSTPRQRHQDQSADRRPAPTPVKTSSSSSPAAEITVRDQALTGVKLDPAKYAIDAATLISATLTLSYRQIDAILELQLYRLTQLSIDELQNELREVRDNIAEYESILASEKKLRGVIVKELEAIARITATSAHQIVDETAELQLEDLIADEQVAVTVSHSGYLKRTPISTYRQQRRGGTGRLGMRTREEDFVQQLIVDSTHAYLLCFTNKVAFTGSRFTKFPTSAQPAKANPSPACSACSPAKRSATSCPSATSKKKANTFSSPRAKHRQEDPAQDFSNVMAAASSPSASTKTMN